MIKKILFIIFGLLFVSVAYSAQVVNIEYIHTAIADKWGIVIPYNRAITNVGVAANMKYLLTAVDVANEILNGEKITDYGSGEFATLVAADTIATDTAVETLVKKTEAISPEYVLELTHYYTREIENCYWIGCIRDPSKLFVISAAGTYYIDWGDGTEEVIKKDTLGEEYFGHDYAMDGTYTIRLGGRATAYDYDAFSTVVLSGDGQSGYNDIDDILITPNKVSGCLGCIFPTLADGSQPRFVWTFYSSQTREIPSNLFDGVHGVITEDMFRATFGYSSLLRSIPDGLFDGMDMNTDLPFGAFDTTFEGCGNLTGPSARIGGKYLYEIWPDATVEQVGSMYRGAKGLDDWDDIPCAWKDYECN